MSDSLGCTTETILVVDDAEMIRKLVVAFLEDANFVVLSADSGENAIKLATHADQKIDLLLSDVQMPHMSGPTLCQTLKQSRPEMQVMLMTGGPGGDELSKHYGWALIQKPFSPRELVEKVTTVLHSQDRSQLAGSLFEVEKMASLRSKDSVECYA
jgi:DNA-binding response OmpR family regulator